jgi:hypothetical protein
VSDTLTYQEMQMSEQVQEIDLSVEHVRWQREMRGLVRALGWKALKRAGRPKKCWDDMISDMEVFSWRAWRSLRLRGLEPQEIGVWAISDRAVRSSLQGARFQPVGTMGDRSWADSIYNKRHGLKVRSNREDWQLTGAVEGEQEESDLLADWATWKAGLNEVDRAIVEALETGDTKALTSTKGSKRKKRLLADRFREFRRG